MIIGLSALIHLVLISLMFIVGTSTEIKRPGTLTVVSLQAFAQSAPARREPPVKPPPVILEPVSETLPDALPDLAVGAKSDVKGDPSTCDPVRMLEAALGSDPTVHMAVDQVPATDRSISKAIVIWNMVWIEPNSGTNAPLSVVRNRVTQTLAALPDECLTATVTGPRLIPIANAGNTSFLVFGSGEWAWQQLLTDAAPVDISSWFDKITARQPDTPE